MSKSLFGSNIKKRHSKRVSISAGTHELLEFVKLSLSKYQAKANENSNSKFERFSITEINQIQANIDRIKALLAVRKEDDILKTIDDFEFFIENTYEKNKDLKDDATKLKLENENLAGIGERVISDLKLKIESINLENAEMYRTKVYSKNELMAQIGDSISQIQESCNKDISCLKLEIEDLKDKLDKRNKQFKTLLESKQHRYAK